MARPGIGGIRWFGSAVCASPTTSHEAVAGVDFAIPRGTVFGLLGPNGAGKTTIVEILEGYRTRTAGEVEVLGSDPQDDRSEMRDRIGIVLQESGIDPDLTVRESIEIYGAAYSRRRPTDELLDLVGLAEKRDARVVTLSGGQKRRLDLALGVVGEPDLIYLDEPTTGFDPEARRRSWDLIRRLRGEGKTILLTTHYMEEAQQLADTVAVLAAGRIVAIGPPSELTAAEREAQVSLPAPGRLRRRRPAAARRRRRQRRGRVHAPAPRPPSWRRCSAGRRSAGSSSRA